MTSTVAPLPTGGDLFLTDSGLETDLLFHGGFTLPDFAAYPLLDDVAGRATVERYVAEHVRVASDAGLGIVVETPTWRASSDWGDRLGHDAAALRRLNTDAVALVRQAASGTTARLVVSGCVGPRGDGYVAGTAMTTAQAQAYHAPQVEALAGADVVSGLTMTSADEAIGLVRAAHRAGMASVVSFTVETDGRLPDGSALGDAVRRVDDATAGGPAYFMVNCAHPEHVAGAAEADADWWARVRGLRANASRLSHAELDQAQELDEGDPLELAEQLAGLHASAGLTVLGGCCGTDVRHIRALAARLTATVPGQLDASAASTSSLGIPSKKSTASR